MKLDKAIEILQYHEPSLTYDESPDIRLALRLSIEAIEFKQSWSQGRYFPSNYLLPGETKE